VTDLNADWPFGPLRRCVSAATITRQSNEIVDMTSTAGTNADYLKGLRMSFRTTRLRGRNLVAACVAAVAVSGAAAAFANDTVFPDGDTGAPSPNLAYGNGGNHDCTSRGTAVSGDVKVSYNGNGVDPDHHFSPGESLDVSYAPAAGSGITVEPGAAPVVPASWGTDQQDSFTIPFTTTVPASTGDGSYAVEVTVRGRTSGYVAGDGPSSPGKPRFQILVACASTTPANIKPSVAFSAAPAAATEGDVKTYDFTITDPDAGQTFSYAAGSPDCGSLGSVSGTPTIDSAAKTGTFSCSFPDGVVPATASTVSVQVTDSALGLSNTATTETTVENADPTVGALVLGGNTGTACLAGKSVTLDSGFSDAGLIDDPWSVDVNWGDGSAHTTYDTSSQGAQSQLAHLFVGAGSWTVGAAVTDKDSGSGANSSAAGAVSLLYSTGQGILQPINYTGPRSAFKIGSTIPVKIKISDCSGSPVSGLSPQVSLKYVDGSPDGTALEDVVSTVPDQGTTMRYTGSPDYQYIYNLATKGRSTGDYTVTVSSPTIAPVSATFSMKK
jgi:hypothetical protein